jgi:hypothetical protein
MASKQHGDAIPEHGIPPGAREGEPAATPTSDRQMTETAAAGNNDERAVEKHRHTA